MDNQDTVTGQHWKQGKLIAVGPIIKTTEQTMMPVVDLSNTTSSHFGHSDKLNRSTHIETETIPASLAEEDK